jgi:hypothetical protein
LLRYASGQPISSRRYDHLWVRIGRQLPWVRTQQISMHWIRHTTLTWVQGRGVASDATFRTRREDDGAGDPAGALSPPLTASTQETADQGWPARIQLDQMQRRGIQFRCVRCQHVASSSTLRQQRRGQMRHLAVGRAEVFSMVGNPLPTSCNFGYAIARAYAGHTDGGSEAGATATYVRASLSEVAAALAALTGEPHPLATPEEG